MQELIAIPKELTKKGDLVIIPRAEYEEYLNLRRVVHLVRPTLAEKKAIKTGRQEIRRGKYLTLSQLKNDLAS